MSRHRLLNSQFHNEGHDPGLKTAADRLLELVYRLLSPLHSMAFLIAAWTEPK
jgi:hypothetical protein